MGIDASSNHCDSDARFKVQRSRFNVQGSTFKVQGSRFFLGTMNHER
jgi:hypothetical protein